jgi:GNAT superfamily N-acetyltransferase
MNIDNLTIRFAKPSDIPIIFSFIKQLATYERMDEHVVGDEKSLHKELFTYKHAEVILAFIDSVPVGFALFHANFSTFQTRSNMYLEDLFVLEAYRHKRIGKSLLSFVAAIAVERACMRLDWSCLDWNQPSIDFYHTLGAQSMDEWKIFRLKDQALIDLATLKK